MAKAIYYNKENLLKDIEERLGVEIEVLDSMLLERENLIKTYYDSLCLTWCVRLGDKVGRLLGKESLGIPPYVLAGEQGFGEMYTYILNNSGWTGRTELAISRESVEKQRLAVQRLNNLLLKVKLSNGDAWEMDI